MTGEDVGKAIDACLVVVTGLKEVMVRIELSQQSFPVQ